MSKLPRPGRRLGTLAGVGILAAAAVVAVPGLRDAAARIRHVSPTWIAVTIALKLASELSFVLVFRLFFDSIPGPLGRQIAWTELACSVLMPAGSAGGLAVGGWLLHVVGAPTSWIVRRSAGLYFLCGAVNAVVLVVSGLTLLAGAPGPHGFARVGLPILVAVALGVLLASLPAVLRSRRIASRALRAIGAGIGEAERTIFTRRPSWRLCGALGYMGFDLAVLWVALKSLGGAPSLPALILAYNIGHLAKLIPIPGGIGTLDAGLTGALVLYGVSPTRAAGAVLLYHAIGLWVPALGGLSAYLRLRPRLEKARSEVHGGGDSEPRPPGLIA